jgi:hypothetical protein
MGARASTLAREAALFNMLIKIPQSVVFMPALLAPVIATPA